MRLYKFHDSQQTHPSVGKNRTDEVGWETRRTDEDRGYQTRPEEDRQGHHMRRYPSNSSTIGEIFEILNSIL